MANAPRIKVYNPEDEYVAAFKHHEDAAMFVACAGDGYTIRDGHSKRHILWTEGAESQPAGESYDAAADIMRTRAAEAP
jgi:hypothetical protein